MCGIYGCIGNDAGGKVLEGLRKLEYRGYDSSGLSAIFSKQDGPIETERTVGFVSQLVSKVNGRFKGAQISIGHTRWATHGGVTDDNAHPHRSNDGLISLVHNGIIENATELSEKLIKMGYHFQSETDTEVIVHLLDNEIKNQKNEDSYLDAFCSTISYLKGSWAIAAMVTGMEGILVSRNGAPLIVGRSTEDISVSSDIQSFYGACSEVAFINDGSNFLIKRDGLSSKDDNIPHFQILEGNYDSPDSGNFPHMMIKEIHDQPVSLTNAMSGRISSNGMNVELGGFKLSSEEIKKLDSINLIGCGTAYHAAQIIASYIMKYSSINARAFVSSEFPAEHVCSSKTLTIGISQSGETKDTLDALSEAKKYNSHISGMCNVIGSTIARYTDNGIYLHAGSEYAVASTKVFTNMIAAGFLFALSISNITQHKQKELISEFRKIPNKMAKQLIEDDGSIEKAVEVIINSPNAIFIGRGGISMHLAKEGALKMMEVSYIPCISLPGGELKHGPIALITKGTPIIALAPSNSKLRLMESTIRECRSRGGVIILITDVEGAINNYADILIQTYKTHEDLNPFLNIIPLQLMAYNAGIKKGINVDRPRNLAKSVTVI